MSLDQGAVAKPKILRAIPNSAIVPKRGRWVWYPYIPLQEITLVTAPTGVGKTGVCLDLAGALTNGKLEGTYYRKPLNVLYVALEDTVSIDITPRLMATGANRDRFFSVHVENGLITLPDDCDQISDLIAQTDAKIVFLDPITSVIRGKRNSAEEIRPAMEAVRNMAVKHKVAIIGVIHQRKGGSESATEGVAGTTEWTNVSRCVLGIKRNKEDPGEHLFGVSKNNRAPREDWITLKYRFKQVEVDMEDDEGAYSTNKIEWCGTSDLSVDDVIEAENKGQSMSELDHVVEWLRDLLERNGGEIAKPDAFKDARSNGVEHGLVEAAAVRLKLERDLRDGAMTYRMR